MQGYACDVWECRCMLLACFSDVHNSVVHSAIVYVDLVDVIFVQGNFH